MIERFTTYLHQESIRVAAVLGLFYAWVFFRVPLAAPLYNDATEKGNAVGKYVL